MKVATQIIVTCVLMSLSLCGHAQSLHIDRTRFIGSDTSTALEIESVISTKDNGLLFVGYTNSNGGGDIPTNPKDAFGDDLNVVVGKLNSNLQIQWIKVYGGNHEDLGMNACQAADSGFAVVGITFSDDRDVSGNHGYVNGTQDIWLIRLDKNGNLMWQQCFGSSNSDEARSVALAPDSGFVLLGTTNGADGDVPFHYGDYFSFDWLVVKTDQYGNKQWAKVYGGTKNEGTTGAIIAADSGYYLASYSASTDYDCFDTSWHKANLDTKGDAFLIKIDTAGNKLWMKSYGSSSGELINTAMWDERDSSILMIGSTTGNDYMLHGALGSGDMWLVKTDRSGKLLWNSCLGDVSFDQGFGVVKATNNGYMVEGSSFPNSTGVKLPGYIGLQDNWVVLTDSMGTQIAKDLFGGTAYERPMGVVANSNEYVAYGSSSSIVFTEGGNSGRYPHATNDDGFFSIVQIWPSAVNNVNQNNDELIIYPNPSKGEVRIEIPAKAGKLEIIDIGGHTIVSRQLKGQEGSLWLDTRSWSKGSYVVKWQGRDGEQLSRRLINN